MNIPLLPFYESDAAVEQYLLFHYGTPEQICPLLPEAHRACGFPTRCVTQTLPLLNLRHYHRALDLGCAVGRSSFELARHFDEVIGIDFSHRFVAAANEFKKHRLAIIRAHREGSSNDKMEIELPSELQVEQVQFEQGDACDLRIDLGTFDLVLMANLIDRLPDPARCLARLPDLVRPGGAVVITSPYTWLEEYTPRDRWLDASGRGTLVALRELMTPPFTLQQTIDLPFLIREHRRKFQWSIAEASLWVRNA